MYFFRFAALPFFGTAVACIIAIMLLLLFRKKKQVSYTSALGTLLVSNGFGASVWPGRLLFLMRATFLGLLAFCCGKPQFVDVISHVNVEGIDIVLVLDASGSMQFADYGTGQRNRFDVAKDEAIRFVQKRVSDAIGLVIFGNEAISRIPLTYDKKMVVRMINELQLGDIDPNGTKLATAMLSAANRLKRSTSKTKIMILLTDGTPSEGDSDPQAVIEVVKKLGIKVYTIGIGSEREDYFMHPLYGMVAKPQVNKQLLDYIAAQTGGKSFMAHNADDMRTIYDSIDRLERTEKTVPLFNHYYDLFWYLSFFMVTLWIVEALLVSFLWIGL